MKSVETLLHQIVGCWIRAVPIERLFILLKIIEFDGRYESIALASNCVNFILPPIEAYVETFTFMCYIMQRMARRGRLKIIPKIVAIIKILCLSRTSKRALPSCKSYFQFPLRHSHPPKWWKFVPFICYWIVASCHRPHK